VTVAIIQNQSLWRKFMMSKIDVEYDLDKALRSKGRLFVLFYASWCPFSQMFLPIFEKHTKDNLGDCLRIKTDNKVKLCKKYSVNVVPTVLLFENGKIVKRLDGDPGIGLSEKQLEKFTE
jgi:thioredoxin-like negative regulator of GroEL